MTTVHVPSLTNFQHWFILTITFIFPKPELNQSFSVEVADQRTVMNNFSYEAGVTVLEGVDELLSRVTQVCRTSAADSQFSQFGH